MRPGTGVTVRSTCFNLLAIDLWTRIGTILKCFLWTSSVDPYAVFPIRFIAVVRVVFVTPRGSKPHEFGRPKKQIYFDDITSTANIDNMMT